MKCRCIVASLALVCLFVSPGWGQTRSEEVRRLQEEMQYLQKRLRSLESEEPSSTRERTTQLGRSRIREEEKEDVLVVRVYDLSDLLAPICSYPAMVFSDLNSSNVPLFPDVSLSGLSGISGMGGMGGMGGAMSVPSNTRTKAPRRATGNHLFQMNAPHFNSHPPRPSGMNSARTDLDGLIDAITSTIEPTSWGEVGGPGTIAPVGNSLIVSNTRNVHEQITALLDTFRKRWGTLRTVTVQAHWLWLTEPQLNGLLVADAKSYAGEPRVFGLVDDDAWATHAKELRKADDESPVGYQSVVTCYNGQTVHTVSGEQRRFIVGMIPVVGGGEESSSSVGYQPVVATLQEGAALQVTPMTTTAGKYVVLDVHSRVVLLRDEPESQEEKTRSPYPTVNGMRMVYPVQGIPATIDRPQVSNSHLETTLRVPVDRRMLVGGMTFQARPKKGQPGLYLFVKLGVQELRDDQLQPKPVGKSDAPTKKKPPLKPAK